MLSEQQDNWQPRKAFLLGFLQVRQHGLPCRSRDLKIVSAAMLIWGFGEGMFYIFQPLYIQKLGASPILIGTILGINGLIGVSAQIPSGYLADKIGRRPLIWFSFGVGALATFLMAWAPTLGFFVAGMLLYGLSASVMAPLNTYVQEARGKWSVGRAISFVLVMYSIGGILGPVVGGILGEMFNLRTVYFFSGGIFTLSTITILFVGDQVVNATPHMEGDGHLLQNKVFLRMLVLIFLAILTVFLPQPLAANFLRNQRSVSISQIGQLGSLGALGGVIVMLIFGHMSAINALLIGQIGVMIFALALWQGVSMIWYGIGYIFLGGFRLCNAMVVALVRPVVREREVGLAFGFVGSVSSLSIMVAPVIAGLLYDFRPVAIFPVAIVGLFLTITLTLVFKRTGIDLHEKG